jgi:uroporphyrinogen decarboxylase
MSLFCIEPLKSKDVKKAINFQSPSRIPMAFTKWWGEGLYEQYGKRLEEFNKYPEDVAVVPFPCPSYTKCENGFFWSLPEIDIKNKSRAHDSNCLLPDWQGLEDFVKNPPNTEAPGLFDEAKRYAEQARKEDRYVLLHHWGLMFERIWGFRGMENLLADYIEEPDKIMALHKTVADTEERLLVRAIKEIAPDGYMHSDDLGSQKALMMNPSHFREYIMPFYKQVWSPAKSNDVDVWLHTCGNVTEIIGDLISCGLSVLHPIQKHTMDWEAVAKKWKSKITFWVGMDVQDTLRTATPQGVRKEVRYMIDTFDSPEGGMILGSGNGIVAGTPFDNIDAFLDECCNNGEYRIKIKI